MTSYIGIIGSDSATSATFASQYVYRISEAMDDPNTHFLLTDQSGISICALKYLIKRKFQNYTVYHIGETPKISVKNSKKYTSYIEAKEAIRQTSKQIIE
ncbi:MAG TPA: hypothetical protein PKD85_05170 [Saprospiraceae bacterium]|nr:hypothetical protein [Saprospiraceae bacterium]